MESVGELIEKLVIANIKLWMVKDAQTAIACHDAPHLEEAKRQLGLLARTDALSDFGPSLAEALLALLIRLDELAALEPADCLTALRETVKKDIELCEVRAALRRAINERLGDKTACDTVKKYGDRAPSL